MTVIPPKKNVVVLGAAYAGAWCAELLSVGLPSTHRVVLVDRQSHFNHVYLFPRASVISSHANKVFVPNTHIFTNPDRGNLNPPPKSTETKPSPPPSPAKVSAALAAAQNGGAAPPHDGSLVDDHPVEETEILGHAHLQGDARIRDCFVHAGVERITPTHVVLDKKLPKEEYDAYKSLEEQVDDLELDDSVTSIKWDYLVYALGCTLPPPLANAATTKPEGVAFLEAQQSTIARARDILIVGGGALGIQYATDIATLYGTKAHPADPIGAPFLPADAVEGTKNITLVHSRESFLQLFSPELGEKAKERLEELGVQVVMGERVEGLPTTEEEREWIGRGQERGNKAITLSDGRVVEYDLLLRCTGQKPNSGALATLLPGSVQKSGYVRVKDTIQVDAGADAEPWAERVFVAGDVADAGVIKAGHTGWNQGELAAQNILKQVRKETGDTDCDPADLELGKYVISPPQIKLTLGLGRSISEIAPWPLPPAGEPIVTTVKAADGDRLDGYYSVIWKRRGVDVEQVGEHY